MTRRSSPLSRCAAVLVLVVVLVASGATTPATAFDGHRKGWVAGGGLGMGTASLVQELEFGGFTGSTSRENRFALVPQLTLGQGLDERTVLSLDVRANFFTLTNSLDQSVRIAHTLLTADLTKFLESRAPATYFSVGAGISTWSAPFEDAGEWWTGIGAQVGLGYEWTRHWAVELSVGYGDPGSGEGVIAVTSNVITAHVMVRNIAY